MNIQGSMDATPQLVPSWLRGTWRRDYIRRAGPDGVLKDPDSSVDVRYIQTPWAFVDVRRPKPDAPRGSKEVAMAFAGVTRVEESGKSDDDGEDVEGKITPPLVNWHSCLDLDASACPDAERRWEAADAGAPRETEDKGYFRDISTPDNPNVYMENDPDNTLEERWVRIDDGDGNFLAARRGTALFVVAGNYFGFASHANENVSPAIFVSGKSSTDGLIVSHSASDCSIEGKKLMLSGEIGDWIVLPGSTSQPEFVLASLKFSGCDEIAFV